MNGGRKSGGRLWSNADLFTVLLVGLTLAYGVPRIDPRPFQKAVAMFREVVLGGGEQAPVSAAPPPQLPLNGGEGGSLVTGEAIPTGLARQLDEVLNQDGRFTVTRSERGLVISFAGSGAFASGSADLVPELVPLLEAVAERVRPLPYRIALEGYTDSVPIHTADFRSNWELSVARADQVRSFFEQRGIDPKRIGVYGRGDTRPDFPNDTPEGRAKNRRVDVVILWERQEATTGQETYNSRK